MNHELIERSFRYRDATVGYHEAGEGPTLVMLHGGGPGASSLSNFSQNVPGLASEFRVILFDQPGYGRSELPSEIAEGGLRVMYADAVRTLLDELGVEKAHFVGNSLGGATTLQFALDYPERADRLVLMGPGGGLTLFSVRPSEGLKKLLDFYEDPGPSLEKMRDIAETMVYDPAIASDQLVRDRYEAATGGRSESFAIPRVVKEELWPRLHQIQHETLLIWGREDRVLPLDASIFILHQMPNARLHVFPKCGHWAQLEWREEFDALTRLFLRSS